MKSSHVLFISLYRAACCDCDRRGLRICIGVLLTASKYCDGLNCGGAEEGGGGLTMSRDRCGDGGGWDRVWEGGADEGRWIDEPSRIQLFSPS